MKNGKEIWIKEGYKTFALQGYKELKIELLAKKVGISKSSFYHHFADKEVFIEYLLHYHIQQSYIIAEKEKEAKCIIPDLIDILIDHKIDLFFNRQLRINRDVPSFLQTLQQSNLIVGNEFITPWKKELQLQLTPQQLEGIFGLALENFFLQMNPENFNREWISSYFEYLKSVICNFK